MSRIFKKGVRIILQLFNITNINRFFDIVNQCKGNVYLLTPQGDRFNLKSTFSKYVAFTDLLSNAKINQLNLLCENEKDNIKFYNFMLEGD